VSLANDLNASGSSRSIALTAASGKWSSWVSRVVANYDQPQAARYLRGLAATIKARWVCEQAHQQLKDELGLDHFEGRSWHVTR
jgi:hypothetical protein